jgi:beta-glucuronidase
MLRHFLRHRHRTTVELDGLWDFSVAPDRTDKGRLPRAYKRTIHVPAAWEQLPGLEAYRGKGWLRRTIRTEEGKAVRLVFGGVSHTGTVFIDGRKRGRHYDAFTPWTVLAAGLPAGEHELVVEADNTFGPHSALHIENDYYTYGGITRPAELQLVPEAYIDRVHAAATGGRGKWGLTVVVTVNNWSARTLRRELLVELAGETYSLGTITLRPRASREVSADLTGLDVAPWTPADPRLYELSVTLCDGGEVADDTIERVGFRTVEVRGRKLLLNGEELLLTGYNRHESHPQFGCALPVEAMMTDLEIMKDLGCNFIRTCHYPNDERFLDLCDELGMLVWEESHARSPDFAHPAFHEQITASTREMVEWHHNHPSIIMWGFLNECNSDMPWGRKVYKHLARLVRSLDATRPITFATNRGQRDLCLDLADVVSFNRYQGWYGGTIDGIAPDIRKLLKWLHSDASRGGRGKPVIMSEFGAGAIYGCRHPARAKWTEEYQADLLDEALRVYLDQAGVVGVAIWQFCDVRITFDWWRTRPRTMNNKGTVDEYRRAKLAYDVVKKRFAEARKRHGRAAR